MPAPAIGIHELRQRHHDGDGPTMKLITPLSTGASVRSWAAAS